MDLAQPRRAAPIAIHRRSLAILVSATATTRSAPDASTKASRAPLGAEVVGASDSGSAGRLASRAMTAAA